MNDSKDLKEKKDGVVENTPKVDNDSKDIKEISGEITSTIYLKEVSIRFDDKEKAVLPYDKFKETPMVGDKVTVRLEKKNGDMVITDIISHEKSKNGSETPNKGEEGASTDKNEEVEKAETPHNPIDDDMELSYLDQNFVLDTMSIPTDSRNEFRMVIYIIQFARRNGIKYEFDDYGNVYLTKGKLEDGEYYPCVTSHLDTVQHKQEPYIRAGVSLDLKCELTKDGEHKLSVDTKGQSSIGIGADDKGGVCICLSMFDHFEKLKACFFLCEEIGCCGSKELDKDWFNDVGYCIGYDSPDLFRAAWSCSGVKLFSYEFYEKWMKPICDEWGLKDCFYSEPITDVMEIRKQTGVMCMNFGNGGYNAHMESEYCIIEHMDHACGMGIALIDHIGLTRHELKHVSSNVWQKGKYRVNNGLYVRTDVDDTKKLESLGDNSRYNRSYSYQSGNSNSSTSTTTVTKDEQLNFEMVKYIVNRYDGHILALKDEVLEAIKAICEKSNIDFSLFEKEIGDKFSNEPKF